MKQAFILLSAALLISGQGDRDDNFEDDSARFLPIDTAAPPGNGPYLSMVPSEAASGQLAHHAEITLFPPQRWGRVTCTVEDTSSIAVSTREENCDKVDIEFVGASAVPPYAAQDFKPWSPFNRYPRPLYNEMNWRFAGFDSGNLYENTAQVTSSPPCLFKTSVAEGGTKVTLYVVDCALWRGWNDPRAARAGNAGGFTGQQVNPPQRDGGLGMQTMFDKLVIFLPWPFLAPNAPFPHLMVDTQATFFLAEELSTAAADVASLPRWTTIGPYRVTTPYVIQSPVMALYSLQLREFLPGAPAQGIAVNTIAGTALEAITVTLELGLQLQAGMKIVLTTSVGPVALDFTDPNPVLNPPTTAPPLAFPLAANGQNPGQDNLIWAVPGTEPTNTFLAVGPACGVRAGSVNCCGQSTAQIVVPQVSVITYPEWFKSLVITLGPAGCVLPVNRRMTFVIPKVFLGKNPFQTVTDPVTRQVPGFWAVQTLVATSAEAGTHFLQRYGGDIDATSYRQGIYSQVKNPPPGEAVPANTAPFLRHMEPVMAADLPRTERISFRDLAFGGTLSSYVVGLSTFKSVTFRPNTLIAGVQPQEASVTITFNKGLTRLVPLFGTNGIRSIDDVTPYFITVFATIGTMRPNVGSLREPIRLPSSLAGCENALLGITTATSNLILWIKDDNCISKLTDDGSSLPFVIPGAFLFPNLPAGSPVKIDARLVPSQHSVNVQPDLANVNDGPWGAVVIGDSAMLMGVVAYTTVADCGTMPNQVGSVNDIHSLTIAARCTLVASILMISPVSGGFLQCNPGATVQNSQNQISYIKYPESHFDGVHYPTTNLPPPTSAFPMNVGLGGTPPVYTIDYGYMFSYPMLAVVVSYPPSTTNLQALGANPAVPAGYLLAFIVRITRMTTACSVSTEYNPWLVCVVVTAPVVNPLYFPAANPNPAGVVVDGQLYGRWNSKAATVACFSTAGDGAIAAWYPTGLSPAEDDSDGAWYAFFALFALPLLLLCCCLLGALYFLKKRKPKSCCPADTGYPVQEMYWVNAPAAGQMYMQPAMPSPVTSAGAPIFMVQ